MMGAARYRYVDAFCLQKAEKSNTSPLPIATTLLFL